MPGITGVHEHVPGRDGRMNECLLGFRAVREQKHSDVKDAFADQTFGSPQPEGAILLGEDARH